MEKEFVRKSPEAGGGENFLELLKKLDREEVLEVFSGGRFCLHCQDLLQSRIRNLINKKTRRPSRSDNGNYVSAEFQSKYASSLSSSPESTAESLSNKSGPRKKLNGYSTPPSVNSIWNSFDHLGSALLLNDGLGDGSSIADDCSSEEQKERIRFSKVGRKKDFVYFERINGKQTNVLQGLELHTGVFNAEEQKEIVECVYNLQRMGQKGQLRERTYSEPRKWMRGKGRVTIQFGCCYNYAVDRNGNPPGIIRDEEVDPLPPLFQQMIKRMVGWHVLPPTCIPNSCIVNIYDEGDCIPPHIDHHDFVRPFCTVSFLTECNILFGSNLKVESPGEFSSPVSLPLPCGSVLILNGNGANVAKHCVPAVPAKRISITFRKMDESKLPYYFTPEPELTGIQPLACSPLTKGQHQQNQHWKPHFNKSRVEQNNRTDSFSMGKDDFPPLANSNSSHRYRSSRN